MAIIKWITKEDLLERQIAQRKFKQEEDQWEEDRNWRRQAQSKIFFQSIEELERLEEHLLKEQKKMAKIPMAFGNKYHVKNGTWRDTDPTIFWTGSIAKN